MTTKPPSNEVRGNLSVTLASQPAYCAIREQRTPIHTMRHHAQTNSVRGARRHRHRPRVELRAKHLLVTLNLALNQALRSDQVLTSSNGFGHRRHCIN